MTRNTDARTGKGRKLSEVMTDKAGSSTAKARARITPLLADLVDVLNQNLDPRRLDPSQKFYLLADTQPYEALKDGQNTLGFALVYSAKHELQGFEWRWDTEAGKGVSDLHIRYYAFAHQGSQSPIWVEHNSGFVTHTPFTTGLARYGHAKFTVPIIHDSAKPLEITATLPLKDPKTGLAFVATHSNLEHFLEPLAQAFNLNKLTGGKIAAGKTLARVLKIKKAVKQVVHGAKPKRA